MKYNIHESVYVKFQGKMCVAIVQEFVKDFCYAGGYHLIITYKEMVNGTQTTKIINTKDYGDGLPIDDRHILRHALRVDMEAKQRDIKQEVYTVRDELKKFTNPAGKMPQRLTIIRDVMEKIDKELNLVKKHCKVQSIPIPKDIRQALLEYEKLQALFHMAFLSDGITKEAIIKKHVPHIISPCVTADKADTLRFVERRPDPIQVSIIIPCYNVEDYVGRCIKSALLQPDISLEVIAIDDGSTDNTVDIIKNLQKNDSRIILKKLTRNSGVAIARNEGLKIASGEYVAFLDSDDYVDYGYYTALYRVATRLGADIAKGGATGVHDIINLVNNNKWYFYAQWWSAIYSLKMLKDNHISFPDLLSGQDFVFQRAAVFHANTVVAIDAPHYHYCKRSGSLDSPIFTIDKIKSNLRGRIMIAEMAKKIENKNDYFIVMERLLSEIHWFWNKTHIPAYHDLILNTFKMIFSNMMYKNEFMLKHPEFERVLAYQPFSARAFFASNINKYRYNYAVVR